MYEVKVFSYSPRRSVAKTLLAHDESGWLLAIVDTIAEGVASARWRAYKAVGESGRKALADSDFRHAPLEYRTKALRKLQESSSVVELPNHELIRFLRYPNPRFTGRAVLKVSQQHLDLVGETFWYLVFDSEVIIGCEPIPPDRVMMTPTPETPLFRFRLGMETLELPERGMLWFRHLSPADLHGRGTGRGLALGDELDASEAVDQTIKTTFMRGGMPRAVVAIDDQADGDSEQAAEDLQKRLEAAYTQPHNAGKMFVAPGKVTLAAVNQNFSELQLSQIGKDVRAYIRQTFNVPPELLGDLTSSNRSTSEEAKYTLAEYAILPRLEFWRSEFQHRLAPLFDGDVLVEFDDPRPQSFDRLIQVATAFPYCVELNEVRQAAGLRPLDELAGKFGAPMPGQENPSQDAEPPPMMAEPMEEPEET